MPLKGFEPGTQATKHAHVLLPPLLGSFNQAIKHLNYGVISLC